MKVLKFMKHLMFMLAVFGLTITSRLNAQTFTTLHNFTNSPDGATPYAGLILSGNTLYGTAGDGGANLSGTIFSLNVDGTDFTNLYNFTAEVSNGSFLTNSDGASPQACLILLGNTLYGTALFGGTNGNGTVFAVNTNGTGFTILHGFTVLNNSTNSDGANPTAGLILSGNTLYGTAGDGGSRNSGTVFAINTNGMGFTNLLSFTSGDGINPSGRLVLSGSTLYGTTFAGGATWYGGNTGSGLVFDMITNPPIYVIPDVNELYNFSPTYASNPPTNSDGANPNGSLILSGNNLYGTTKNGGTNGAGTIFAVNTNSMESSYGIGITTLHTFTGGSGGANPVDGLILWGNTLYGTTQYGGENNNGTVFAVNTNGTGFTILHGFTVLNNSTNSDGAYPQAGLILSGNTLYGTASQGGSTGNGTIFSLSLPLPQLTIILSGTNVILTWPTNAPGFDYSGFTLQSTTNLVSPVVWSTNSPAPTIVNGQNAVTNPISGTQQFYRLSQ
jgi:uncharacterized repeat protein (TIGR03803 family)